MTFLLLTRVGGDILVGITLGGLCFFSLNLLDITFVGEIKP